MADQKEIPVKVGMEIPRNLEVNSSEWADHPNHLGSWFSGKRIESTNDMQAALHEHRKAAAKKMADLDAELQRLPENRANLAREKADWQKQKGASLQGRIKELDKAEKLLGILERKFDETAGKKQPLTPEAVQFIEKSLAVAEGEDKEGVQRDLLATLWEKEVLAQKERAARSKEQRLNSEKNVLVCGRELNDYLSKNPAVLEKIKEVLTNKNLKNEQKAAQIDEIIAKSGDEKLTKTYTDYGAAIVEHQQILATAGAQEKAAEEVVRKDTEKAAKLREGDPSLTVARDVERVAKEEELVKKLKEREVPEPVAKQCETVFPTLSDKDLAGVKVGDEGVSVPQTRPTSGLAYELVWNEGKWSLKDPTGGAEPVGVQDPGKISIDERNAIGSRIIAAEAFTPDEMKDFFERIPKKDFSAFIKAVTEGEEINGHSRSILDNSLYFMKMALGEQKANGDKDATFFRLLTRNFKLFNEQGNFIGTKERIETFKRLFSSEDKALVKKDTKGSKNWGALLKQVSAELSR
ncbi:hypothetical protein HZA42_05770 [Candidatus Peregrinibacteria bacterium]|nr:hypothetical protein [Candidatus Peregrinibacteria bacterium]